MQLTQAVISGIQIGLIYALVAVGLTIIWGLMGMINFAHGELMMWGMFAAWSLSFFFKLDPIVTLVPIGLAAYVVGAAIYRLLMARVQRGEIFTQIFASGVVAQIGWDGEKHLLWPWDKAAQSGYKVMFPSPSWDERAKHPAP